MVNRINAGHALNIGGMEIPKTPEMLTVEGLQCQLAEMQIKGEKIIMEATDEIMKRNACLQEGLRIVRQCREVLAKGTDVDTLTKLFEDIDRWAGSPEEPTQDE